MFATHISPTKKIPIGRWGMHPPIPPRSAIDLYWFRLSLSHRGDVSEWWFHTCLECIARAVIGAGCRDTRSAWVERGCRLRSSHHWYYSHPATTLRTPLTTIVIRSRNERKPPFWYTISHPRIVLYRRTVKSMQGNVNYSAAPPPYGAPTFAPYPDVRSTPSAPQSSYPLQVGAYGQPPAGGYAPQPVTYGAPPPHPHRQQHQQQVLVVNAAAVGVQQQQQPVQSFGGQIACACIVFWFCNCLFGLIAFILASQYHRIMRSVPD